MAGAARIEGSLNSTVTDAADIVVAVKDDSVTSETLATRAESGMIAACSAIAMFGAYAPTNYALLEQNISPLLMIIFLITGVAANAWFAKTNGIRALEDYRRSKTASQASKVSSWLIFTLITMPLSIAGNICLFWAALSGIKLFCHQLNDRYGVLEPGPRALLGITAGFAGPGVIAESFFSARSAELIMDMAKTYLRMIGASVSLCRQDYHALCTELLRTCATVSGADAIVKLKAELTACELSVAMDVEAKARTYQKICEQLWMQVSYQRWYKAAQAVSIAIAIATSIAFALNGTVLIESTWKTVLSLAHGKICDPSITPDCGPDFSSQGYQALFFMANLMIIAYGVIFGREGAIDILYNLPVRILNNASAKNILGFTIMLSIVGLCCGNALSQGLLAKSAQALVILGAMSAGLTNLADALKEASDNAAEKICTLTTAAATGVYNIAASAYQLSCCRTQGYDRSARLLES